MAFGWRARRTVEALLLHLVALHASDILPSLRDATIDRILGADLFKRGTKDFAPPRDFTSAVQGIQRHGNAFSHFQTESLDHRRNAEHVAIDLVKLVEATLGARQERWSPRVRDAVRAIESEASALIPPEEIRLRAEVDALRARPRVASAPGRSRPAIAAGGMLTGVVVAALAMRALQSRREGDQPNRRASATAEATLPTPPARVDEAIPAAVVADAGAACPSDTEDIPAMSFRLDPLPARERPWGPLRGASPRARHVSRFCLARDQLTRAAVESFGVPRPSGSRCRPPHSNPSASCVSHDEAREVCSRWHPRGRLPTSLEWEAAARAVAEGRARPVTHWEAPGETGPLEWVDEAFPAPWLARGPLMARVFMTRRPIIPQQDRPAGDQPWNSWNRHAAGPDALIFVRCAVTP